MSSFFQTKSGAILSTNDDKLTSKISTHKNYCPSTAYCLVSLCFLGLKKASPHISKHSGM